MSLSLYKKVSSILVLRYPLLFCAMLNKKTG